MSRPPKPSFSVVEATDGELFQACLDIRIEVFVVEQGFSIDDEVDEYDDVAVSFLLYVHEESTGEGVEEKRTAAGTIRIVPGKNKIGRLSILKPHRAYGFGRDLMLKVHEWARKNGDSSGDHGSKEVDVGDGDGESQRKVVVRLESQIYAIPFYAKLGYQPQGEPYEVDGAPHQLMTLELTPEA